MIDGLVIDRSQITHRESKLVTVLAARLQKAHNELDADALEATLNQLDDAVSRIVVSVPDGWLPKDVKVGDPNWMDALSQSHYEDIMAAANPTPEKKGG